jgi:hypothetical protein
VASINKDGKTLHLTGWVTLANANSSSFVNANTQVVAGKLNREDDSDVETYQAGNYSARCWPWDSTSTYPSWNIIPPMPKSYQMQNVADIIVTAQRREAAVMESPAAVSVITTQEQLGDLKLYRVPFATTVAANAQKQVLMLDQSAVPFERIYHARIDIGSEQNAQLMTTILHTRNEKKNNLGLAMPSGKVAVFETVSARPMLAGEDDMRDTAVHEEVEIKVGAAPGVRLKSEQDKNKDDHFILTLTNDQADPINAEVELNLDDGTSIALAAPSNATKNGRPIWRVSVPANGNKLIRYRISPKN